ncbi:PTS lactose/cellobiose transporter subunit IIA [Brenneria corticis]|uniref:PTS lactose/cellobiose transporter subunit IIA n=1 Tax=Brenneria corticis TaxID=2173106 RepID=A0A2U1U1E3_9GAMM|nr:PTS lactose/cellobiose transporter subunit IIA [Brenneria sp. CFCC 11842]
MNYEEIVINIIVNAGQARSRCINAIEQASIHQFEQAQSLIDLATEDLRIAHQTQTRLIEDEARGVYHPVTLLMVHAQDHLMNALTLKDIARQQIECYRQIFTLAQQLAKAMAPNTDTQ